MEKVSGHSPSLDLALGQDLVVMCRAGLDILLDVGYAFVNEFSLHDCVVLSK